MKRSVLVSCVMVAVVAGLASGLEIPLTVLEPAGVARWSEPVSGGIPLPWGQFKQDQTFALFDGDREIPVQTLPLVVDEKGYLRWILVDFQTDLEPRQKKEFLLKTAVPRSRPQAALKLRDTAESVTLDTGKIVLVISRTKPFSLFTSTSVNGVPMINGGEVSYTDSFDGRSYVADKPSSVEVEYAGPLRTTIKVVGRFVGDDATKLLYIARITAWAGRSDVHVKYSLANSNDEHYTWRRIKDSSIVLRFATNGKAAILGAANALEAELPCWIQQSARVVKAAIHGDDNLGSAYWLHKTPGASSPGGAKAVSGGKEIWSSAGGQDRAQGWVAAKVGAAVVCVNDLYFVEDPPRRLSVAIDSVILGGIVEPLDGTVSPFADKHRWLADCSHLSSQYHIEFLAPSDTGELSKLATRVRGRLHLMARPSWYFETGGLSAGTFGTQADELACYEKWGWQYSPSEVPSAPAGQWRNMARWQGGDDNHYTSEQDSVEALLLMYLRTGSRAFFDACETWANYFMDLQAWRTDGWRFKDGGVWWTTGGPLGNSPQRGKDPVSGLRNGVPAPWSKEFKEPFTREAVADLWFLANAKACYCHNWGEGIAGWFCITGDRDALETAIDCAEQNYDTQRRAFRKTPGQPAGFSRDFTRACYLINATRLCAPTDPFLVEASDYLARVYLERPVKEPRGFLNGPQKVDMKTIEAKTGPKGVAKMRELGITLDEQTGELVDPASGARWKPLVDPHTWMFPPLSMAMEVYYRITGNEDAMDWLIAYGQAVAHVLFQKKHGNLSYGHFLVDFPTKGFAWDRASWDLPDDSVNGEGVAINGYLAQFYPDVPARAYELCGDLFLKQRAYDFWYYGSHRGYNATKMHNIGRVGKWVNVYSTHDESVTFTGKTFYHWAHERKDQQPPAAVKDLAVVVQGDRATVSFTAPSDQGGGRVVRYQVKCSDKPIVSYEEYLKLFAENKEADVCNWWLAKNLGGEPIPGRPGSKESFMVSGVPENAKYFAVCSFDDSSNRSPLSNIAETK